MATATTQPRAPSQIRLVLAIGRELERQGFGGLNARQLNALIAAADEIVREVSTPDVPSTPASGLRAWLASDDTGLSSKAMAARLAPLIGERVLLGRPTDHPHDPDDFGRCLGLLEAAPELRQHLPLMADVSPEWARLVGAWDELEGLYREERPTGTAPRLFERLKALTRED
jgi:hypothetical protein